MVYDEYQEYEDERTFDTGIVSKGFTLSMGKYEFDEKTKELLFLEGLASFIDEEWRIKPTEVWGGRIKVYNPKFIGFSDYSYEPMWDITGCLCKIEVGKAELIKKSVNNLIKELRRDSRSYLERMMKDLRIACFGEKATIPRYKKQ